MSPADISKTTYTYVVYHRTDDQPDDLGHALAEAYDGSMVGSVIDDRTEPVDPGSLVDELVAIGNDGEFFDEPC